MQFKNKCCVSSQRSCRLRADVALCRCRELSRVSCFFVQSFIRFSEEMWQSNFPSGRSLLRFLCLHTVLLVEPSLYLSFFLAAPISTMLADYQDLSIDPITSNNDDDDYDKITDIGELLGFRITGGRDFFMPITIFHVNIVSSLSTNC